MLIKNKPRFQFPNENWTSMIDKSVKISYEILKHGKFHRKVRHIDIIINFDPLHERVVYILKRGRIYSDTH